jgi:hypothetical protein
VQTFIYATFVSGQTGNNDSAVVARLIIVVRGSEPSALTSWSPLRPSWMFSRIKFGVLENATFPQVERYSEQMLRCGGLPQVW